MCGIAAIVRMKPEADSAAIDRMTETLAHRGPDAAGITLLSDVHLGHRRLSIIDLAGGSQPMTEITERYWIVFNGEIYNFRELRATLESRGQRFRTHSDTEVLIKAYEVFGEQMPVHLNGQFAFAIWDQQERRLFAARDRMGEKPFFWATAQGGAIVIASEIKSIIASGLIRPILDPVSVDAYLALLYVPPDRTIYANVQTLPPAHAIVWDGAGKREWCYWKPRYSTNNDVEFPEAAAKCRELLQQAVTRQLVADVPVGAFLSGGLDSSTIVAMMSTAAGRRVPTFSVGFGDLINELPYAAAVAERYGTEHHEVSMDIPVGDLLQKMADVYDEPFADSSNLPTYLVAGVARQHVPVALSGDGGDELFGGYSWYLPLLTDASHNGRPASVATAGFRTYGWNLLTKLGFPVHEKRDRAGQQLVTAMLRRRHPDVWERHLAQISQGEELRASYSRKSSPPAGVAAVESLYRDRSLAYPIDQAVDFDVRSYLPGDILVKVDRAAMAHGLETRAPFLDVDLVEFVLSLPPRLRFRDDGLKGLLRAACQDLWPPRIHSRKKQGFGGPIASWIRRPEVRALLDRVTSASSPLSALLPGVANVLTSRRPQNMWTLLCLGLWLEKHPECVVP